MANTPFTPARKMASSKQARKEALRLACPTSIENAEVKEEVLLDKKTYHTVYEVKNGQGPAPIKTKQGWLHLAHGVRNTAAGLRYVLYIFMTDLNDLTKVTHKPGGYFIAPEGEERVGDVSNVTFGNGWIADEDGTVFIYYASSDTRMHVATTTLDQLLDYVMNTPADGLRSAASVETLYQIIDKNKAYAAKSQVAELLDKEKWLFVKDYFDLAAYE